MKREREREREGETMSAFMSAGSFVTVEFIALRRSVRRKVEDYHCERNDAAE